MKKKRLSFCDVTSVARFHKTKPAKALMSYHIRPLDTQKDRWPSPKLSVRSWLMRQKVWIMDGDAFCRTFKSREAYRRKLLSFPIFVKAIKGISCNVHPAKCKSTIRKLDAYYATQVISRRGH